MSHYDLYASLGLDRTASTTALATDIDRRIAELGTAGGAQYSELRTARAVLGDEERRRLYDQQLDNPTAPEITRAAVEELAAMPVAATAGHTQEVPVGPPPATAAPVAAAAPARRPWVIPAAVATVVVAVAAVVIVWLVTSNGSDSAEPKPDADFRESTTTSSPTPAPDTSAAPSHAPSSPPRATPSTPAPAPDPAPAPGNTLVTESGNYGVGLAATQKCGSDDTRARYVLVGDGSAKCDVAGNVGDRLAGDKLGSGEQTSVSAYSPALKRQVALTCTQAQDSDRDRLWKCSVDSSGSIVYVYP